jgi:UDP-3-O-[3-hydroxymyristoyl] glucosamine N-acyltransferase
MTLKEIAERLGCRLEGDGTIEVQRVAGLDQAGPGDLTFFANPKYAPALRRTRASAVIVGEGAPPAPCAVLRASDPYLSFAHAITLFDDVKKPALGIDSMSRVAGDARMGQHVSIGPFVSIGAGVSVGDRTVIYPNVSIGDRVIIGSDCVIHSQAAIRERTRIGDRVIVQNGAVLGGDGYGFVTRPDGTHQKIPQISIVVIEDDVEIGANTTIDRPAVGETRIQAGTKIDNLVQIGHGVRIGTNSLLAAQVGIAGSTVIGNSVVLGGQVGVAGHVEIGDRAKAVGQSGITNSLPEGAFVSGYPAIDNREWLKSSVIFRKLPELRKRLAELEDRVANLEAEQRGQTPFLRKS